MKAGNLKCKPTFGLCDRDSERSKYTSGHECKLQRTAFSTARDVHPIVHEVLQLPGQPLDRETQAFMEPRLGHDFSRVRVHTSDAKAAESAQAVNALAYTLGKDIVFGSGQYVPTTHAGKQLLAHELTHVVQQEENASDNYAEFRFDEMGDSSEIYANRLAENIENHGRLDRLDKGIMTKAKPVGIIQRQLCTPLAPGGGFSGLMDRDRAYTQRLMSTPFHVCSRALQIPGVGWFANHAYIETPLNKYAVIGPLCMPADKGSNNVITGTVASKWDNSPDPCGKSPRCVPCHPKRGVSDVGKCLRDAFNSYSQPSLYKILGPNSNTFAGTLARSCCADMVPQPPELGIVPGWDDSPAPARAGDCPDSPSC